jgi:hypothetical protein
LALYVTKKYHHKANGGIPAAMVLADRRNSNVTGKEKPSQ